MRAAILTEPGGTPVVVEDFEEPKPTAGGVIVEVATAGLGAWDVLGGQTLQLGLEYPSVVRGEGVGRTEDGRRVYFGEHPIGRSGAWAARALVDAEEVWDVPDDIEDRLAITMAIAATGAMVPLEQAEIKPGEHVLILGATGSLGQTALQLARYLGAGRVVGAGRSAEALARLIERGIADAVVQMGGDDDAAALIDAADGGFDVVLDTVYGWQFAPALKSTRFGARIMSIGIQAGFDAVVHLPDLFNRHHTCVGTGQAPAAERRATWERLLQISRDRNIDVDYAEYTLDRAPEAWAAMANSPHAKVIATIATS